MGKGALGAIIHGVTESDTTEQLSIHTSKDQFQYSDTNLVGKVPSFALFSGLGFLCVSILFSVSSTRTAAHKGVVAVPSAGSLWSFSSCLPNG